MEIKKFHSEEELSSIRFSCADEAVGKIKNLFFEDQLVEEEILLDVHAKNRTEISKVPLVRLNINRIFSRNQLTKKQLFVRPKLVDSVHLENEINVATLLFIKAEQNRLGKRFKSFYILQNAGMELPAKKDPLLFVQVDKDIFYLLNDCEPTALKQKKIQVKHVFNWIKKGISIKMFTK